MTDILQKILTVKCAEVTMSKEQLPVEELAARAKDLPNCRDFHRALTTPSPRGVNVIAEIKRASPSAGLIRSDFNPITLAGIYHKCRAAAISVLTDEKFFQGKPAYLQQVRETVPLPLLRKDFIIDPYQVYEARCLGADAILLIAEALDADALWELTLLAESLQLTVLLEVHERQSLERVKPILESWTERRCLLGINNRNLKTMQVDLQQSLDLGRELEPTGLEGLISESGIQSRRHVEQLAAAGFDGILIGETLMRSKNITDKFIELFGP